jgi:TrmH family RNA methyltransferase
MVEGLTLVQRAMRDGLPVAHLLYTPDLLRTAEGLVLLHEARLAGIDHSLVTEGLMGKITTTRPVPTTTAAVCAALRDAWTFKTGGDTALLIADNINNPNNLGMLLRTADAAGVEGVVVLGEAGDPFHKHCVRAARGAVGRIPLLSCQDAPAYLRRLREEGSQVVGATAHAPTDLYHCRTPLPAAVVVGNEQDGLSPAVLEACSVRVRIPMAPGQDSLNVGVAAGVLLYEIARQRRQEPALAC